ncbi:MAG: ORF6N domain-containing protein [Bacteroidales bacterium]|nr:ORF6N domain-containing protein [Bacteroidales bacterium]MCF8459060.1 ORF6N domain-containing protein [Bacteroidales bacterium]
MNSENSLILLKNIQDLIFNIRGVQVMMDSDLAEIYGVELKRLNEQVKRNMERFPASFRFQLNEDEMDILRSQIATSKKSDPNLKSQIATSSAHGGRRYLPFQK